MPNPNPIYNVQGIFVRPNLKEKNPYKYINETLANQTSNYKNLYFIPYLHPCMDDEHYLNEYYDKYKPIAYKVHGIGSRIGPDDVKSEIIDFIKRKDLPLIIHTDCPRKFEKYELQRLREKNKAIFWCYFLIKNNIKGTLNHGVLYDKNVFDLVNNFENIRVALGPDKIVSSKDSVTINKIKGNYLTDIQKYLDIDKMIFDIDYNWNIVNEDEDLDIVKRYKESFKYLDYDKVIGKNALKFYNIHYNKGGD